MRSTNNLSQTVFHQPIINVAKSAVLIIPAVSISLIIGYFNFLLFHSIVELIGVFISFTVAILAYNTYPLSRSGRFASIGIAYGFISILSVFHVLAYDGMGVFRNSTGSMGIYFSITSKYLEIISLLIIPFIYSKKKTDTFRPFIIVNFYMVLLTLIMAVGFFLEYFNVYLLDGSVPTLPKNIHEMIITILMFTVLVWLIFSRKIMNKQIHNYMAVFIILKILSQICILLYEDIYNIYNVIAHIMKLASYYCFYKALIEYSLRKPMDLLFKNLKSINEELEQKTIQLSESNEKLLMENTERKEVEEKLRQSKALYKQLIKTIPVGVFLHTNGVLTFVNDVGLEIIGASNYYEAVGKQIMDFVHPDFHNQVKNRIKTIESQGRILPAFEQKFIKLDGSVIDVEVTSLPFNDRKKVSVMGIVHDITERKRAQELEASMHKQDLLLNRAIENDKIKTDFFVNISHELRTPLNIIFSTLQLSSKYLETNIPVDKEKVIKHYSVMNQNCRRLLKLVNNLIDITKIDVGYMEPHMQNCNIVEVIEEITLSVAQFIEGKGISLLFDTEVEEKIMAFDPEKIERIMLNLLTNSMKFTEPGGSITVSIFDKDERILICVRDTGIGIPENKQKIIFERFRQVDQSLTRNHEGSGIGLSLVKSLVEMHHGTVAVESKCGIGSKFIIELPVKQLDLNITTHKDRSFDVEPTRIERIKMEFSDIYQYS